MYCQLLKILIQQIFKDMLKKLTLKMHEWNENATAPRMQRFLFPPSP